MNIVDNHPATIPTLCPVAVASLARTQEILFEKEVLKEFFDEDESLTDTIDNLEQLLAHLQCSLIEISPVVLIDLRMALKALSNINKTMKLTP